MKNYQKLLLAWLIFSVSLAGMPAPASSFSGPAGGASQADYVFRRSWGGEGDQILNPIDLAIDPVGRIYTVNLISGRITRINQRTRTFESWQETNLYSRAIDLDNSGNIYVTLNDRIQKFSSGGNLITQWGSSGSGNGQFGFLEGLAVDASGNVFVADSYNDRIQKFDSSGNYITQWGSFGSGNGQFSYLDAIAVDKFGNVYAVDGNNETVQKFDNNGGFLAKWGSYGSGDGQLSYPTGIAVDGNGNVYVTEEGNARVQKFSSSGTFLAKWGSSGSENGQFFLPRGISLDGAGNIYVADYGNNRIQKFNSSGKFLNSWGSPLSRDGQFNRASDVAVDASGKVYTADYKNNRIQKFSEFGTFITKWGSWGGGAGQFYWPTGLDLDGSANVYVNEGHRPDTISTERIQIFTSSGGYLSVMGSGGGNGQFTSPDSIAVDKNGYLYVADSWECRIQKFDSHKVFITQWGTCGSGDNQVSYVEGITTDLSGNVYVADSGNDRILKFNGSGGFLGKWGSTGSGAGQFKQPGGISADADGNVFVADQNNHRIQKFTGAGVFLTQWGSYGSGPGQFIRPAGIAVDLKGNVYVADAENNRIQVFSPAQPAPDSYSGLVQNGSFENLPALAEWTTGGLPQAVLALHSTNGLYSLQLGSPVPPVAQGESSAWAYTNLYVRPDWTRPLLTFKYNLFVNDIQAYSDFFAAVQDGAGLSHLATVVQDGYRACPDPNQPPPAGTDLGWRSASYDLSAYKGQNIRVVFSNRNLHPESWGIWSYVDDVRILDAGPLPAPGGPLRVFIPVASYSRCDAAASK